MDELFSVNYVYKLMGGLGSSATFKEILHKKFIIKLPFETECNSSYLIIIKRRTFELTENLVKSGQITKLHIGSNVESVSWKVGIIKGISFVKQ